MARRMIDYRLADDGDLDFAGGDFVREESTYQHQRQLLQNAKGDYKATPLVCVDLDNYRDDTDRGAVRREIAQQFMADGMRVNDLSPNEEALTNNRARVFNNSYYE